MSERHVHTHDDYDDGECPDCLAREQRIAAFEGERLAWKEAALRTSLVRSDIDTSTPDKFRVEQAKAATILLGERDEALRARDEAKEQVKEWKDRRGMAQDDIDAITDVRECLAKEHRADETEVDTIVRALNERAAALAQVEALAATLPETFYAGLPLADRVKRMVENWRRATKVNQELEAQVEGLRGAIQKAPVKVWLCSQHGAIVGEDRSRCGCATRIPLIDQNAALGAEVKPCE